MTNNKNVDLVNNSSQPTHYEEFYLKTLDEIRTQQPTVTSSEILSYVNTIKTNESMT